MSRRMRFLVVLSLLLSSGALAQTFSSGSNGSDGALDFRNWTGPAVVEFNPKSFNPPLDPDGDNIYHFTTIDIPTSVTLRLSERILGSVPVYWLAQGDVNIAGVVDLNGEDGKIADEKAWGGAGGYSGGLGANAVRAALPGQGPGGGLSGIPRDGVAYWGEGGTHAGLGTDSGRTRTRPKPYGSRYMIPLWGGSGGGGGEFYYSFGTGSGAGGGGALCIASPTAIDVQTSGRISARGGSFRDVSYSGDSRSGFGGAGSGGSVRLMAERIQIAGAVTATGGVDAYGTTSAGRISLEAVEVDIEGTVNPAPHRRSPLEVFPSVPFPSITVTHVGGVALPPSPTGSFSVPDATINSDEPTTITLVARRIPPGTVLAVTILPEEDPAIRVQSTPLVGTREESTAEAVVTFPRGFSRGQVFGSW